MAGTNVLVIPALGQPFRLGRVYDCRNDLLIPGITLWDPIEEKKNTTTQPQPSSNIKFVTGNTTNDKALALDMNAGLTLSVLAGLVDVSGSAQFLQKRQSSKHTSRLTMQYNCTTRFDELNMTNLNRTNISHDKVFEDGLATHVVTGILYGANTNLIIDYQKSGEDLTRNIKGELKLKVEKIPGVNIGGGSRIVVEPIEKKISDNFSVEFIGDIQPPNLITTFDEAGELIDSLSKELKNYEKAVPVKVWLYPLRNIDTNAATLAHQINASVVTRVMSSFDQLNDIIMQCNDLGESPACTNFSGTRAKLEKFRSRVEGFMTVFKTKLMPLLPEIRAGKAQESEIQAVIQRQDTSPFQLDKLSKWLTQFGHQVGTMNAYLDTFIASAVIAENSTQLAEITMSPAQKYCLCLCIRLNTSKSFLDAMKKFLQEWASPDGISNANADVPVVTGNITNKADLFKEFLSANAYLGPTAFVVAEDHKITQKPGSFIYLYRSGNPIDKDFEPPSQPPSPRNVAATANSITIAWKAPEYGSQNVTHFKLSHKAVTSNDGWVTSNTAKDVYSLTITNLMPGTRYEIKVEAVCVVGSSKASKTAEIITKGDSEVAPKTEGTISPNPNFNVEEACEQLHHSLEGANGVDKSRLNQILVTHSNAQLQEIKSEYRTKYTRVLDDMFKQKLSGKHEKLARALLEERLTYEAEICHQAVARVGTDKKDLIDIISTKDNEEIAALKVAYEENYKKDIVDGIMGGNFKNVLQKQLRVSRDPESNPLNNDKVAKDVKDFIKAGAGIGTDEAVYNEILCTRSYAHLRAFFKAFEEQQRETINSVIKRETIGAYEDALLAIVEVIKNKNAYFSERLQQTMHEGLVNHGDLIRLIVCRCEIDLANIIAEFNRSGRNFSESVEKRTRGDYRDLLHDIISHLQSSIVLMLADIKNK